MSLEEYKLLFEEYVNEKVSKKSEFSLKFRFHKLWKIMQISMFVIPPISGCTWRNGGHVGG